MKPFLCVMAFISMGLLGCGGGDGEERQEDNETYVRLINAVTDIRSVTLYVNSEVYYESVGYLQSPGYFRVDTDDLELRVTESGSFAALYDSETSLVDDSDQTLFVFGTGDQPRSLVVQDDNEGPGDRVAKVRLVNLSTTTRTLDVYLTTPGRPINSAVPTGDNLGFGAVSDYFISDSGSYTMTITDSKSTSPLSRRASLTFEENSVYTIVIADTFPGGLPLRAIVLKDR